MVLFTGANGQTVITAGNDTTICIGGTASLTGTVISGSYGTTSYTFEPIAYLPEPFSGGTGVMFDANQDDRIAGPFDIGFSFCFFNQNYTQFYIGSNGWVGFSFNNAWTTFTAQPIPNTNDAVPKNCIMAPWQDWWPGWTPDGQNNGINVFYYLTGTAPNRKLVVYWTNCPLYNCTDQITKRGIFQIVLNEQNSIIENHIQKKPNCSDTENATQGVHNSDGTIAFTADGRNCTPWTATNESTRFVPSGIRWFVGGYPGGTVVGYGPELVVSPTTTTTYTVAVESCGGGTATDDVTVTVVDATFNYSPSVFCSNDPDPTPATLQPVGTFTGTPSGLVIDPANGTIDITASIPGTYQVTHTISTPCLTSFTQTITLNPSPAEPQPLQDSVFRCGPGDLSFSVVPQPGETYSWYDAPVAGNKLGTGSTLVRNVTTTTTLWVESQTIASTCISTSRASVTGVVNPIPSITNITTSFTQCDDLPFDVAFTSDVTGALFTWTCTPSSATITGWSDNAIPAASLNQTLNNTGNLPESVIYHVTPIADGCTGIATNFTVTVQPTPVLLNTPLATSICSGISPNISLTSNVAGALFTWTCTPSSPNITGWSPSAAPGILIDQVLTNLGTNSENVVYHITPAANGCSGLLTDYTVTVNPPPDVSFNPPGQIICSQQTSNIQLLSTVSSATFSWTVTSSSPNLSGQLPGSGTSIAQTILNSGATVEALTYTVTPSTAGCPPGTPANVILTVKPTPVITNGVTSFQICSGSSASITLAANIPGTAFSWTASGSSVNITGFSGGSGSTISQALTNLGMSNEWVSYDVIPNVNGCSGSPVSFVVTVFPVANVVFNPPGQTLCSGGSTAITLTSGVTGTTFTWTASGSNPSVTGYLAGNGNIISQTLNNSGYLPGSVTYVVLPTANGCPGTNGSVMVTLNPLPQVTFVACSDPVVTTASPAITLAGGTPAGGTYSGPGVSAGQFLPGIAGTGTHLILYTYSNTWGCSSSGTHSITVIPSVPFTCGSTLTDPRDNQSYPTVQIGSQCWMAANLNYGSVIASNIAQRDNCVVEKYCFGDNPVNCTGHGGLYQWDELMNYSTSSGTKGLCPPEWHIPAEAEWNTLFTFYTSSGFAGSPLKYSGFSGFDAFLSGVRFNDVKWDFNNFAVLFWSSTARGSRKAWAHGMNEQNPSVSYYPSHRNNAFPVRCVKD